MAHQIYIRMVIEERRQNTDHSSTPQLTDDKLRHLASQAKRAAELFHGG
jgi:hypothetical protein